MRKEIFSKAIIIFTLFVTLAIIGLLCWEHYHGGVSGHNLLKRKDLPFISNWWGALVLPLITFLLLNRVKKQINFNQALNIKQFFKQHLTPFLIALLYAILIVVFSSTGNSKLSYFMFLILFVVALGIPIFKSEYLLGFILGLTYTFGGALPVIIALVLAAIFYLIYNYIRPIFIFIGKKINQN